MSETVSFIKKSFKDLKVNEFFKESSDADTWYLKSTTNHAQYNSDGVEAECRFFPNETVFVESPS